MFSMPRRKRKSDPTKEAQVGFLGTAARVEDLLVINLPPDVRRRTRFSKGGKMQRRYTLEIETEPIFHNLDEGGMGREAAELIAEMAGENLRKAGQQVSKATQKFRQWAEKVYYTGQPQSAKSWVDKRYAGGRIGETPPDGSSTRYGVDSGRLADGMFARLNETGTQFGDKRLSSQRATWTINVPANRLNSETWRGDESAFMAWLAKFREMVNLSGIVSSGEFQEAVAHGLEMAMGTLKSRQWQKQRALLRAQWKVVAAGARLLAVI